MFHAELEGPMNTPEVKKLVDTQPSNKYSTFLASRPRAAENDVRTTHLSQTRANNAHPDQ